MRTALVIVFLAICGNAYAAEKWDTTTCSRIREMILDMKVQKYSEVAKGTVVYALLTFSDRHCGTDNLKARKELFAFVNKHSEKPGGAIVCGGDSGGMICVPTR